MWLPQDWTYPCYNVNNGRYNSLLKWKNSRNVIYEELTDTHKWITSIFFISCTNTSMINDYHFCKSLKDNFNRPPVSRTGIRFY